MLESDPSFTPAKAVNAFLYPSVFEGEEYEALESPSFVLLRSECLSELSLLGERDKLGNFIPPEDKSCDNERL